MKAIKPSHREKKRYLLIKGKDATEKNIDEAILKYVGILGYSKASPRIIKKTKNKIITYNSNRSLSHWTPYFLDFKLKFRATSHWTTADAEYIKKLHLLVVGPSTLSLCISEFRQGDTRTRSRSKYLF